MINLGKFGTFGLVLFIFIFVIMEAFFLVISYYIPQALHLAGIVWWIVAAGIFIILNAIFVNIN